MDSTHFITCPLCEALCGLTLTVTDHGPITVRGDREDPLSQGFLCPKGVSIGDLHNDPDRLRQPLRRTGSRWEMIGWNEALELAAHRLDGVRREFGPNSVAFYTGNPNLHSYAALLFEPEFVRALGTRTRFSTASMDHLPHLLTSFRLFGHPLLVPVPDLDRTRFLLVLGANPAVSNGSMMSAPGIPRRFKAIRARGGRIVVVDPRRTKSAAMADAHLFIRPGTDALLLLAMLRTLFEEGWERPGRLASFITGMDRLRDACRPFVPEAVVERTGIEATSIRALTRDFVHASADRPPRRRLRDILARGVIEVPKA